MSVAGGRGTLRNTYLNEGVVQEEHHSGEPPRPFVVEEQHLPNVAYILDLRMAKAELPGRWSEGNSQNIFELKLTK